MIKRCLLLALILWLSQCGVFAQSEFADVIIDAFYSGTNPDFSDFYGNNGTTHGCRLFLTDPAVCLGDSDNVVCLPEGSYITVGFTDNLIFDAPGQDDLFIQEQGGGLELGEVWVSPDGVNFTFLDTLNGRLVNSYDLSDYPYDDVVKAVRVVGLDFGGCNPGLELQRVFGIQGANCDCGAELGIFPPNQICAVDSTFDLNQFLISETEGLWAGPGVSEDSIFNPRDMRDIPEFDIYFLVNFDHPVCPVDSVRFPIDLAICDCMGIPNGDAVMDECGLCLLPNDPSFNDCADCLGVLNGEAVLDTCGVCLSPNDPEFNNSCRDCSGEIFGEAVIDLCGNCLSPDDPEFNRTCSEIFKIYLPNIFDMNSPDGQSIGPLYHPDNAGTLAYYEIYDRWGNLVYGIYDTPLNEIVQWWDGRFQGSEVNTGIYVFRISVAFTFVENFELAGALTLIK